jgi:hypothetical protein
MARHLLLLFCMVQLGCVRAGFDPRAADSGLPGDARLLDGSDGPRGDVTVEGSTDIATAVDALVGEAAPSGCNARYGDIDGYILCQETVSTCVFFFKVSGGADCQSLCAQHGGTCLEAYDTSNTGQACVKQTLVPCTGAHSDAICTCTR